ncbi:hypothetical protein IPJ70_04050 [Candidatus Campbellbacteria bacterium]|nr:MAG: hypothetical protein IPJ70_04050 [Candidatus Campbellbacteria bacterium]
MSDRIASNPWYVYGGAFGALVFLVCSVLVFKVPSKDFFVTRVGDIKTYTDTRYGFRFSYPASFVLFPPASSEKSYTAIERCYTKSSNEECEALFAKFSEKDNDVFQEINKDAIREYTEQQNALLEDISGASDSIYIPRKDIRVTLIGLDEFRTKDEIPVLCQKAQPVSPDLLPDEICRLESASRELMEQEKDAILNGPIGSIVPRLYFDVMPGGIVVESKNIRGIRGLWISTNTDYYNSSFTTYTKDGSRLNITLELVGLSGSGIIRSSYTPEQQQQAENDPRNKVLDEIISSFEFLE